MPRPEKQADGSLRAHIIHIDRFGNLITDAEEEDLPAQEIVIEVAGHIIEGLSPSYAAGGELLALIGSSGHLELAVREGNAAQRLGLQVGDTLILRSTRLRWHWLRASKSLKWGVVFARRTQATRCQRSASYQGFR